VADHHPIVGPEGLATDLESLARQISAVEKQAEVGISNANLAGVTRQQTIHELIDLHMHYRDMLNKERKEHADTLYERDHEAVRVALQTLDNRLAGFPKEFASLAALAELGDRLTRFEDDTRQRLEKIDQRASDATIALERKLVDGLAQIDKRLNEGLTLSGERARAEGRPGQDVKTSQGAILSAIGVALVIIGVVIAIASVVMSS
jgi:hypothetical protein